jgi:hypothetical protein
VPRHLWVASVLAARWELSSYKPPSIPFLFYLREKP